MTKPQDLKRKRVAVITEAFEQNKPWTMHVLSVPCESARSTYHVIAIKKH